MKQIKGNPESSLVSYACVLDFKLIVMYNFKTPKMFSSGGKQKQSKNGSSNTLPTANTEFN